MKTTEIIRTEPARSGGAIPFDMGMRWNRHVAFEEPNEGQGGADEAAKAAKAAEEAAAAEVAAAEAAAEAAKSKTPDEVAKLLKEVMANKEKLRAAEAARVAAEERAKLFEGLDPQQIKDLVAKQKEAEEAAAEAERKRLSDAGDFETLKKMMADDHAARTKVLEDEVARLTGALGQTQSTNYELTVGRAFSDSKFVADNLVLTPSKVRVLYGAHFEIVDGTVVGFDKPKGAEKRVQMVGADGKALSFEDALKKLVDADPDKETLLKSNLRNGSGGKESKVPAQTNNSSELKGLAGIKAALLKREQLKK